MTIREAEIRDSKAIAEIGETALGYPCDGALVEERLMALDPERDRVFVAEKDGEVIGFIQVETYLMVCSEKMVKVNALSVANEHKGCGAGRKLMEKAESWGRETGCTAVILNSAFHRTGAHAFYEHIGFTKIKDHKTFQKNI